MFDTGAAGGRRRRKRRTEVGRTGARFGPPGQWRIAPDESDEDDPLLEPPDPESEVGLVGARFGGRKRKPRDDDPADEPAQTDEQSDQPQSGPYDPPTVPGLVGNSPSWSDEHDDWLDPPEPLIQAREREPERDLGGTRWSGELTDGSDSPESASRESGHDPGESPRRWSGELTGRLGSSESGSWSGEFADRSGSPESGSWAESEDDRGGSPRHWSDDHADWLSRPESHALVRPYAWTGGRTRARSDLALEALVSTAVHGPPVSWEHRAIADLCARPRSVAEIAALLGLPLGVARVLIGDLADRGVLTVHQIASAAPNLEFMERVLAGLRKL
ncbi:DUF742 domain-containing protein [Actinokineospora iranica]|nr:DUF742 domain-containing protein [Actinokineospora iranica]